jgi:hypothetical protein
MLNTLALVVVTPIVGAILLISIAALSGRKIEISRQKITFWEKK